MLWWLTFWKLRKTFFDFFLNFRVWPKNWKTLSDNVIVLITDIHKFRFPTFLLRTKCFPMFYKIESRFFHFKAHCWSEVWTENSEKKFQLFSWVVPNHRGTFRWVLSSASLQIAFLWHFWEFESCFFDLKPHS